MSAMKFPCVALLCGCLLITGCGGGKEPVAVEKKFDPAASPKIEPPVIPADQAKVKKVDTVVGKGTQVAATGDTVWMIYSGRLKSGTIFDSNTGPDKDVLSFALGTGTVIKGWDEGIPGMRVGGKRRLE